MKGNVPFLSFLITLFALIVIGGGVMIWLSYATEEPLGRVDSTILSTADWMIKSSAGAILGLGAGGRLLGGKPKGSKSG